MYLGLPPDKEFYRPVGLAPRKCYWSGLYEAPSGMLEDYRLALGDNNGDPPFSQPPLKVVEV